MLFVKDMIFSYLKTWSIEKGNWRKTVITTATFHTHVSFQKRGHESCLNSTLSRKGLWIGSGWKMEKVLKIPCLSTTYVYGLINCNDVPRTLRQKHVSEEKKLKWLRKYMKSLLEWSTYNHFWNMWLRNIDAIFLGTNKDI